MKAIAILQPLPLDDPACFVAIELPDPRPGPRELLVRVRAISVNPVDTKVRKRRDPAATEPAILGWDAAGVVEAVGSEITLFQPGDEVYYSGDVTRGGCNSELHLIDERVTARKPATLDFPAAAALPLTTLTAWEGLFECLGISSSGADAGKSILILGGAGGVGSIAIQLAVKLAGLNVIATASRPESSAWCREMGAHHVVNHREPLAPQLTATGFPTVDFIFCLNDTSGHWRAMAEVIRPLGAICAIVDFTSPPDLNLLKSKSVRFSWEFMATRPMFQTPDLIEHHRILTTAAALLDDGTLRGTHTETLGPLSPENLALAHRRIEDGHTIGKLVLTLP